MKQLDFENLSFAPASEDESQPEPIFDENSFQIIDQIAQPVVSARLQLDELLKRKIVQVDPRSIEPILKEENLAPIE